MQKSMFIAAGVFALFHLASVAPFVPFGSALPVGLGTLSMSSMALSLLLRARPVVGPRNS